MRLPNVPIFDDIPEGWADISHIVSAPSGYHWLNNRKSIFSPEYRHALLKLKDKSPCQTTASKAACT